MGLGQYNSLGEYCDPRTASSGFLILFHFKVFVILLTRARCSSFFFSFFLGGGGGWLIPEPFMALVGSTILIFILVSLFMILK